MAEWQPIETAPKDYDDQGDPLPILLTDGSNYYIAWWNDPAHPDYERARYKRSDNGYWSCSGDNVAIKGATHWMPLPRLPKEGGETK